MAVMMTAVRGECGFGKHQGLKLNETRDTVNRTNLRLLGRERTTAKASQSLSLASYRAERERVAGYFLPKFIVIFSSTATPNLPFGKVSTRTTSAT